MLAHLKSKAFKKCIFCYFKIQAFALIGRKQTYGMGWDKLSGTYKDKMVPNTSSTALSYQNEKW